MMPWQTPGVVDGRFAEGSYGAGADRDHVRRSVSRMSSDTKEEDPAVEEEDGAEASSW